MIDRWFLAHPRSVDETYRQHMQVAGRVGLLLIAGGIGALIHAIFPQLHQSTGSRTIFRLADELGGRRSPAPRRDDEASSQAPILPRQGEVAVPAQAGADGGGG